MDIRLSKIALLLSIVAVPLLVNLAQADPVFDRRPYMSADEEITDDPRRVPVPRGHGDHDGALVLVGGRLLDGTGSAARSVTVVTQGKKLLPFWIQGTLLIRKTPGSWISTAKP